MSLCLATKQSSFLPSLIVIDVDVGDVAIHVVLVKDDTVLWTVSGGKVYSKTTLYSVLIPHPPPTCITLLKQKLKQTTLNSCLIEFSLLLKAIDPPPSFPTC